MKAEKALQSKPIYTCPPKVGSYGYNKTTISEIKGAKGVVSLSYFLHPQALKLKLNCFLFEIILLVSLRKYLKHVQPHQTVKDFADLLYLLELFLNAAMLTKAYLHNPPLPD